MEEQGRTEISSLGEFGLIDHLTMNNETRNAGTILSVGDDAAVIDQFGRQCVISTDMLIEGIHFDLMYTPLKHLGYKSVVVNLSDICSMMATPTHITVSIGISNRFSVEALTELYDGVYAACERYNVDLVGGDTTTSDRGLVISVTAIGEVAPDKYVTRSGAKDSDLLCVTGTLGGAYLGLQLLEREKRIFLESPGVQPDLQNRTHNVGRILKPEARTDIVNWLQEKGKQPKAMIDISDGLSSEILHICKKSGVGCVLYENKIPIHDEFCRCPHGYEGSQCEIISRNKFLGTYEGQTQINGGPVMRDAAIVEVFHEQTSNTALKVTILTRSPEIIVGRVTPDGKEVIVEATEDKIVTWKMVSENRIEILIEETVNGKKTITIFQGNK